MANLSSIQQHFKVIGKLIHLAQMAPTDAEAYRKGVMGTVRQGVATGVAAEYSQFNDVLSPMVNTMKGTVTALDAVPTQAKSVIDNYLRRVVAVDLGLPTSTTANAVAAALRTSMITNSADVGPSGDNANGFAVYFNANYNGVQLPQDADPSIVEAWIDDDVV
jgi:hypothetical protein